MKQKLFSLDDLNKGFWKKVIVVDFFCNMSRQGWSSLTFITQNQQEYFIGFEGLKYGGYLLKEFFHFQKINQILLMTLNINIYLQIIINFG